MRFMNVKTKQIVKIVLLLAASGYFLFEGFSLLFSEAPEAPQVQQAAE